MASRVSDWYFTNGNTPEEIRKQVDDIQTKAAANNHRVQVGVNAFAIARETEAEAREPTPKPSTPSATRSRTQVWPRPRGGQLGQVIIQRSRSVQ